MASIFTKIINGEIPCYKIAEDENYFAFLDINPLQKGHTLVVPKLEVDRYFDLDENTLAGMSVFSKRVAKAIKLAFPCDRIGMTVIGLEVPHAHIHLIPINSLRDMDFSQAKLVLTAEEMQSIAKLIQQHLV